MSGELLEGLSEDQPPLPGNDAALVASANAHNGHWTVAPLPGVAPPPGGENLDDTLPASSCGVPYSHRLQRSEPEELSHRPGRKTFDQMSVDELKLELANRGLDSIFCFTDEDLINRLREYEAARPVHAM